jgi:hypothetical protein
VKIKITHTQREQQELEERVRELEAWRARTARLGGAIALAGGLATFLGLTIYFALWRLVF